MFNRNPKPRWPLVRTRLVRTFGVERLETRAVLNAGPIIGPARDPWQSQDQPVEQQASPPAPYAANGKQSVSAPHGHVSPGYDSGGYDSMPWSGSPAGHAPIANYWYSQPTIIIFVFTPPAAGSMSSIHGSNANSYADAASHGSSESGPQRLTSPPVEPPVGLAATNAATDPVARTATARSLPAVVLNGAAAVPVRPVTLANPVANPLITGSAPVRGAANVALADPFEGLRDSGVYPNLAADVKVVAAQAVAEGDQIVVAGDVEGSERGSANASIITAPASKVLLAEIPFNLHGLEQAVQTVMGQVQRLGTEFTEWLEENQLTTTATVVAAAAAGSGVFYLRRRAARAADRRDEEASSNWLFVQLQTAPSRD